MHILLQNFGYKYGKPETRPAKITNPNDYGALCFDGNTLVFTEDGFKPIKNIELGDKVYSHKGQLQIVTETMSREADDIIKIHTPTQTIITTKNHPFFIYDGEFKFEEAFNLTDSEEIYLLSPIMHSNRGNIKSDSKIFENNGMKYLGTRITYIEESEPQRVYNIGVENDESYLVTYDLIATHNCKHLTAMLSNKRWLQQVTGTLMDWVVKRIDEVNRFLKLTGDEQLTTPNEEARTRAKQGFYKKLSDRQEFLQGIADNYIEARKDYIPRADIFHIKSDLQNYIKSEYKYWDIKPNELDVILTLIEKYKSDNKINTNDEEKEETNVEGE